MEMEEAFRLAQSNTRFIKERKNLLYTFGATRLPYICLSQAIDNLESVNIRRGEVTADKPKIAIPGEDFSFEGFEKPEQTWGEPMAVLLARHITLPPSKYINKQGAMIREQGPLSAAIERVINRLENDNDVRTGVIAAPDQVWNLSVLLYAGSQVARSASANVQEHFEHLRLQNGN
ncbi:MAG: hypothetical protein LBU64_01700 [Planctomycetota bacterium]|jgi:hypothetical protein|nr:hypothetical protein [Planctomycetota bacterium]